MKHNWLFPPDPMEYFKENRRGRDGGALKSFLIIQQRNEQVPDCLIPYIVSVQVIPDLNLIKHGEQGWEAQTLPKLSGLTCKSLHNLTLAFWGDMPEIHE